MANKSVIEYPSVSTVLGTDVLYLIRGTGSDRDKKVTVSALFGSVPKPILVNTSGADTTPLTVGYNSVSLFLVTTTGVKCPQAVEEASPFVVGDINMWSHATVGAITETTKTLWINSRVACGQLTTPQVLVRGTSTTGNGFNTIIDQVTLEATVNEAIDGFGSARSHYMKTLAGVSFQQGFYGFRRDGANNSHKFVLACLRAGSAVTTLEGFGDYVKVKGFVGGYRKVAETGDHLALTDYNVELIEDASGFTLISTASDAMQDGHTIFIRNSRSTNSIISDGDFGPGSQQLTLPPKATMMVVKSGTGFTTHFYHF